MSDIKWIKVAVDMFEDSKIEFIRSLPEGDAIIVTWIQMMAIAGKSNAGGYLMVTDGIPYTEQLLSNALRRQPVLLQFALETLKKLNMINIEDGPYHISKWEKHQNVMGMEKVKSDGALRQQRYRERLKNKPKLLTENVTGDVTSNVTVTHGNATDIELDKDKDIKRIYMDNVSMTETQYSKLLELMGEETTIDFMERYNVWITTRPPAEQKRRCAYLSIRKWFKDDQKSGSLRKKGFSQAAARMEPRREPIYGVPELTQEQLDSMQRG